MGAVNTAKRFFSSIYHFSVSSLVDFAATVNTDFQAGFNGYRNEIGKSFEKPNAEFSSFFGQLENFLFFLAYFSNAVFNKGLFFQLLQKRVNETWANLFPYSLAEFAEDFITVGGFLVQYS